MKKTIKGLLILLLIGSMIFVLTGCGDKESVEKADKEEVVEQKQETNVEQEEQTVEFSMGEWNDNTYTNDFLGLKFNLPQGWTYSSDEELEQSNKQMKEQNGVYYVSAIDSSTGNNINIFSEKIATDVTIESYMNELKTQLSALESITYEIGETSKEKISGKECQTLEMVATISGIEVIQKYFTYQVDEYIVSIITTSVTGEDAIDQIMKSFE